MLKCKLNEFACHFGIKCSSFCKVNVGTSMRSACTSLGFMCYQSVSISNKLLERHLGYTSNHFCKSICRDVPTKMCLFNILRYQPMAHASKSPWFHPNKQHVPGLAPWSYYAPPLAACGSWNSRQDRYLNSIQHGDLVCKPFVSVVGLQQ